MATRSSISIRKGNKVTSIYCHWDGYLSHNGQILLDHYTKTSKIEKLIALGSLSSLGKLIKPRKNTYHYKFNCFDDSMQKGYSKTDLPHTFDTPHRGVCNAHYRDRQGDFKQYESENFFPNSMVLEGYDYMWDVTLECWFFKSYDTNGYWEELTQKEIEKE
jgi:hypothetical protein